ncbi:MAG: serine hydrolase [Candidatus Bathyarchaeota archaeon]|nr:serine hydrolase [Candidatus Bathyarchaeota archaeon]
MTASFSDEKKKILDGIASKAMEKAHAPGVSVALLKDGEIVYSQGYGARDLEKNLPANPDTLYGIGSCTKSFICLAVMKLVEEGKINVTDPIRDHLPLEVGYKDTPITVHNLMSHSSGFPSLGTAGILIQKMCLGEGWVPLTSQGDFYSYMNAAGDEVDGKPGEKYYYLNAGFTLLGLLIEKVSGLSLEDYLHSKILKPLGMTRTTLLRDKFESDGNRMTAYWRNKDGSMMPTVHPFHELVFAPGGILSSTVELTNYLKMYLNDGKYNGKQLIDADLLKEMTSPHTKRPDTVFGSNAYGYGWGVMEYLGHEQIVHTGSTGVSAAYQGYIPDLDIGVAFLSNTGYWSSAVPHAALALLMDNDPYDVVPYLKQWRHWEKLTGSYKAYRDTFKVDIVQRGGMLFGEVKNKWSETTIPLIPVSDDPEENAFWIYGGENGRMKIWFEIHDYETRVYYERWVLRKKN